MLNKLVFENLKHRPIRSLLSITAIGVQVAMMLTLVGLSNGMLQDTAQRTKGIGADILVKPPGSSIIGLTTNMTDKYLPFIRKQPHVKIATAALIVGTGGLNSVSGLNLPEFDAMSGGFHYLDGRPFHGKGEIIVDQYYAREQTDSDWVRTPVDAFVLEKLREKHLTPAAEADRATLIRRLSYDLHGLPPNWDDIQAFVNDRPPDAYEN